MVRRIGLLIAAILASSSVSAMAQDVKQLAISPSRDIRLERSGPTRIPLTNPRAATGEAGKADFQISPPRGPGQTYLVLKNIFAASPPGVGYDVYLDLPAGRAPPGRHDPHYVGTFHFYDTSPGHPREVRLNITDRLRALAAEQRLSSRPTLTVVPGASSQSEPRIGSVALEAD